MLFAIHPEGPQNLCHRGEAVALFDPQLGRVGLPAGGAWRGVTSGTDCPSWDPEGMK